MFDLHPDGERAVLAHDAAAAAKTTAQFVFDFFDELRRMAPQRSR
jgi:hypothetical protein